MPSRQSSVRSTLRKPFQRLNCVDCNLQFARGMAMRRSALHWLFIALCVGMLTVAAVLTVANNSYLGWN